MSDSSKYIKSSTQKYLDIFDINNNFLILKNGNVAAILTVNAMNFGLLAEEEQDAIIYAYAGLLNSINYPIQVIIKSKTKDVTSYLKTLQDQEEKTTDEEKRQRIKRYRLFVTNLIKERNVLDKNFYIAIPATAVELGFISTSTFMPGNNSFDIEGVDKSLLLEKAKNILEPKVEHLISQFNRIGLLSRQLKTQEIIKVFYSSYNPEAYEGQEITDSKSYSSPIVQANFTQKPNN